MKQLMLIATCIVLTWFVVITSCKKNNEANKVPIAKAGADVKISFSSCTGFADLDGSGSTDPDNNITSYNWAKIYGQEGIIILNRNAKKTRVENISTGEYAFELTVRDAGGLLSRDTILISANGPVQEYDFDLTFNSIYNFTDNLEDCYYSPCSYYDFTRIEGKATILPFGEFNVYVSEYADTATLSDVHNTYIHMYVGTGNSTYLGGTCSVNFKKLLREGGGAINGTFTVDYGSAQVCDANVYNNLPPLSVTGSLDLAAHRVSITIKGKVFF